MIKNKKGFTLIELLIVVAIIGILAVALVPTISDAPSRARDAARKTLVNNVITAVESYNIDEGGYPVFDKCLNDTTDTDVAAFVTDYLGGKDPVSTPSRAETETGSPECSNADETAVFYNGTTSGYTVGIALEGKGTDATGATEEDTEGSAFFVVARN